MPSFQPFTDPLARGEAEAAEPLARPDRSTFEAHLARRRYGRFTLTEAIRPGWRLDVVPQEGYRFDIYSDPRSSARLPAIIASVSSERLFETFVALLEPLGETCDVILETSHEHRGDHRGEHVRERIERTILESVLWDFEDLLTNDGCTGIAVMHPQQPLEVQLDEHKLLIVYAASREPFADILRRQGLPRNDSMRVISQGEHLHTSNTRFARQYTSICHRLTAE
jgi:hypothetical protein